MAGTEVAPLSAENAIQGQPDRSRPLAQTGQADCPLRQPCPRRRSCLQTSRGAAAVGCLEPSTTFRVQGEIKAAGMLSSEHAVDCRLDFKRWVGICARTCRRNVSIGTFHICTCSRVSWRVWLGPRCLPGCAGRAVQPAFAVDAGAALRGEVHGGQQPVAGALIQLYAASGAGDGAPSVPLLTQAVSTDASGGFRRDQSVYMSQRRRARVPDSDGWQSGAGTWRQQPGAEPDDGLGTVRKSGRGNVCFG